MNGKWWIAIPFIVLISPFYWAWRGIKKLLGR